MTAFLQLLRTGLLTVAWLILLPCLAVLLSALFPVVPWVRVYLADIVPNHAAWLVATTLAVLAAALSTHLRAETRVTRTLLPLAMLAVVLAIAITVHLLAFAERQGARIDLLQTFSTQHFSRNAKPDESHVYARPGGEALRLDIYRASKASPGTRTPVMMVVHGGGFFRGKRSYGAANLRWYAERGLTIISIDYRLARDDRPTWDLATRDVQCAMAWTAAHADALGIDIGRLVLNGISAGGSLVLNAAYTAETARADPACGPHVPPVAAVFAKVPLVDAPGSWTKPRELQPAQQAVLRRYVGGSPEQYPDRYATLDPGRDLASPVPPTLIVSASDDPLIPAEGAAAFVRRARAMGRDVRAIVWPYSGHEFNTTFGSIPNQAMRQIVLRFARTAGRDGARPPR